MSYGPDKISLKYTFVNREVLRDPYPVVRRTDTTQLDLAHSNKGCWAQTNWVTDVREIWNLLFYQVGSSLLILHTGLNPRLNKQVSSIFFTSQTNFGVFLSVCKANYLASYWSKLHLSRTSVTQSVRARLPLLLCAFQPLTKAKKSGLPEASIFASSFYKPDKFWSLYATVHSQLAS